MTLPTPLPFSLFKESTTNISDTDNKILLLRRKGHFHQIKPSEMEVAPPEALGDKIHQSQTSFSPSARAVLKILEVLQLVNAPCCKD